MSALVTLASLRGISRHPWQIGLSLLGIALGVAVVIGIDLASASSLRGFRLSTEALTGSATHEIRAGSAGLSQELFAQLAISVPDVAMAPVLQADALVMGAIFGERRTALTLFGVDPFSETNLRPWLADLGAAQGANDGLALIREPATGLISADTAQRLGVARGDSLRLRIDSRIESVRILGVIVPEGPRAKLALDDLLVVDIATAQELCHQLGRITRIDLALPEGERGIAREAKIAALLPAGAKLELSALRAQGLEDMTHAFRLNLRALSLLALLVGVFLVYNTMTFSVLQRRPLIATLRTLGVTRAQIFRTIAGEALWLGVIGTCLGIWLGTELAQRLIVLISQTMNDLYFVTSVREVRVDWGIVAQAAAMGVGATLLGALPPAIEATRERPRLALSGSNLESRWRVFAPRLFALGACSIAVALLLFSFETASLVPSFIGLLFVVLSVGLWTPLLSVACSRLAAPLFGRMFGMFGRHAARGIEMHLSRTSVAIAALAVALSATIGMGVMIDSFRSTFVKWLELTIEADIYVSAPTLVASHNESTLDPASLVLLTQAPGVAEFTTYRGFETRLEGRPIHAAAITLNQRRMESFEFSDARAGEVWPFFDGKDALIVTESFGYRNKVGRGDRLTLATDRGPRDFEVLGTYSDFASDQGFVLISRASYERCFFDRGVTSAALFCEPDVDVEPLVSRLRALVPQDQAITIRSNRVLREGSLVVFERTFAITAVLRLLATAVAFVGVLSALLSLELERAREIGILRAQGVTPREVRRLVIMETGLMGSIAGLIAMPLGFALAMVLILVINKRSFGWSLDLQLDPWLFVSTLSLALLAALLAGLYPAWRMSRSRPALALRGD